MSGGGGIMSGGKKLFSEVTELTGLPEELISEELKSLLERKGVVPEQMTMESLREALADYLTEVITQMGHDQIEQEDEISAAAIASESSVAAAPIKAPTQ